MYGLTDDLSGEIISPFFVRAFCDGDEGGVDDADEDADADE